MKNKLAENMLRFGVKNLKAEDVKKIEDSVLTEGYTDPNTGITWGLDFKDEASLNNFIAPVANTESKLFKGYNGMPSSAQITFAYWAALALLGIKPSRMGNNPEFKMVLNNLTKASSLSQNQILRQRGFKYAEVLESFNNPAAVKWWNDTMIDPKNPKMPITRWGYFFREYILPDNAMKTALLSTSPMAPTSPAVPSKQ
jgi:hypothetical protein